MSYIETTVSDVIADGETTAERLIVLLKNKLTELSSRFTLENDVLMLDGKYRFVLTSSGANVIEIEVYYGENKLMPVGYETVSLTTSSGSYSGNVRVVPIVLALNDNVLSIKFKNYYMISTSTFVLDMLFFTADNTDLFSYAYSTATSGAGYAINGNIFDSAAGERKYTAATRLPYVVSADGTTKEIIESKILLSGRQKAFEVKNDMLDCSTLVGNQKYPTKEKEYYALNNNTLIPV